MSDRYQSLREIARNASLDAIALVPGANFTRLLGVEFHQNERPVVVFVPAKGEPLAVIPDLELGSFAATGFEGEVFSWRDQDGYQTAFDNVFKAGSISSIGVEGQTMRVFVDQAMRQAKSGLVITDAQQLIAELRLCKTAEEIAAVRNAIRISETALTQTIRQVRVGLSEAAIESILVQQLFAAGAKDFAFSPIVAAGSNSAKPHASARSDYQVQPGDALLIDFGGCYGGMRADITRTFFIAHCSDQHRDLYKTVLSANLAGHAAVNPGVSAHDIDEAATAVLEASVYADRIRHKTGHGLGRDIHEDPYIMRGNHQVLAPGMLFTIEPGLYADNDIGIRIEDDVLVTDNASESLTTFDKSLTIIG